MPVVSTPSHDPVDRSRQSFPFAFLAIACSLCLLLGPRFHSPNAAIMAAIFITSIMSSIVGFSFAAIGGAALIHLVNQPSQVVTVMTLCGLVNQAAMTWLMRRELDWRPLRIVLAGGVLGLPFGVGLWIFAGYHVDARGFGLAMIAIGVVLPLLRRSIRPGQNSGFDFVSGFIGGITGGAFEFPGASVAIWCNLKGGDKLRQRAIFQPFMLVILIAVVLAMSLFGSGRTDPVHFAWSNLFCVPLGLFGTVIGMTLYRRMSDAQFSIAVSLQLIMSGLSYIIP